jgi:hypothetical protein
VFIYIACYWLVTLGKMLSYKGLHRSPFISFFLKEKSRGEGENSRGLIYMCPRPPKFCKNRGDQKGGQVHPLNTAVKAPRRAYNRFLGALGYLPSQKALKRLKTAYKEQYVPTYR